MAKKLQFIPILGDLSKLTEAQQADYIVAACDFLGVPPELGLVSLQWMDSGDSARQLILYVKKGATDIIRDHRGISVDELTETNGDGYVGWKVKGHDKTGRTEIAVGAVSTKGISGRAIADAVAIAQTKACRRMTLQFAGGGFLDETEINEKTTNLASAVLPLSVIAQPSVQPNNLAGKDITPAQPLVPEPQSTNTPTDKTETSVVQAPEIQRKMRKRRNEVDLDSPISVAQPMIATVTPAQTASVTEQDPVEVTAIMPQPMKPDPVISSEGTVVTKEQENEFKKKLSHYANVVLPSGGFLQSETLGGRHTKLGLFVKQMFPRVNTKALTLEQWTEFFTFLENKEKELGLTKLVEYINVTIGDKTNDQLAAKSGGV